MGAFGPQKPATRSSQNSWSTQKQPPTTSRRQPGPAPVADKPGNPVHPQGLPTETVRPHHHLFPGSSQSSLRQQPACLSLHPHGLPLKMLHWQQKPRSGNVRQSLGSASSDGPKEKWRRLNEVTRKDG
ncbi:UNVERIFIED_CONTAM: hypothetical protein FKN15_065474 [Acipenser sinensis]